MLREESREFLKTYWKEHPNPEERKLQERYKSQNPSGKSLRIVKQINDGIVDIAYALEYFPDRYREKIELEKGFTLFKGRILDSHDEKAKLRIAREQIETGINIIKTEMKYDDLLTAIYLPKFDEIEKLVQLLIKSKTRLIKHSKKGSLKSFEEMSLGEIVRKVRKN